MVIAILLVTVLFIAGLINVFFNYFPTKKLQAWFKSFSSTTYPPPTISTATNKVKKSTATAAKKSDNQGELKRVFSTFDKDGDGFITKQELRLSLKNIKIFMTDKEIEETVAKLDANGDGLIELDEFCELFDESMAGQGGGGSGVDGRGSGDQDDDEGGEMDLKEAFDVFDEDKDGLITVEELGLVLSSLGLNEGKKREACREMIRKVDMDGDGMVNFDEFKKMMRGGGGGSLL